MATGTVAGIDGCRNGWVVATTTPAGANVAIDVLADLAPIIGAVRSGAIAVAGVDMPIGLTTSGARAADTAARRLLGPRRSSLFPTPPRDVLHATTFADANDRSRAASGKGISVQTYNLLPKMRELAKLLTADVTARVFEVHPETSFAVMRNAPCAHPKLTAQGRNERFDALAANLTARPTIEALIASARGKASALGTHHVRVQPVDVLDALAALWTARRIAAGTALILGDECEYDAAGLHCTIRA